MSATIPVNNQLEAQFFFLICLFQFSLHVSSSHVFIIRTVNCINTTSCICHLYRCQMSYWYNWLSWWWAHDCSKHVEGIEINIEEKRIVLQVWYLQGLYRDARSAKHKISATCFGPYLGHLTARQHKNIHRKTYLCFCVDISRWPKHRPKYLS